jgi:hypothetical protein
MFKFKLTPERHNAIQNLNYYVLPDPPLFSLPSTFNMLLYLAVFFLYQHSGNPHLCSSNLPSNAPYPSDEYLFHNVPMTFRLSFSFPSIGQYLPIILTTPPFMPLPHPHKWFSVRVSFLNYLLFYLAKKSLISH